MSKKIERMNDWRKRPTPEQLKAFVDVVRYFQSLSNKEYVEIQTYRAPGDCTKYNFIIENVVKGNANPTLKNYAIDTHGEQLLQTIGRLIVDDDDDSISEEAYDFLMATIEDLHPRS